MYIAAPPNSNSMLFATQCLFRTDNILDPNLSWTLIEHNLHGDQHAIALASSGSWYVGDDGGAWASTHRGDSWTSLNHDLRTLEFLTADEGSVGSGLFGGGTNDNGPLISTGGQTWKQVVFGDGTYTAADPQNPSAFFMSEPRGNIFYVPAASLTNPLQIINFGAGPPVGLALPADFLAPFEILPTDPRLYGGVTSFPGFNFAGSRILLAGANNPWLIAFDPSSPSNSTASIPLTNQINNVIRFIAPMPSDPTSAYFTGGLNTATALFRLNNISFAGNSVVTPINTGPLSGSVLGHLAVSPGNPGNLYVIKAGFVNAQKIFKSEDGGSTWINISGNLPNIPLNWVVVDPSNPDFIYVASDVGVFVSTDGGAQDEVWQKLGTGLPNVPVTQIKAVQGRKLLAATWGRNVWILDISHLTKTPSLQYAAKFMCGTSGGESMAPGSYYTSVNVHNPGGETVVFRKKFAVALPGENAGPVSNFFTAKLCYDQAFEIECSDIVTRSQSASPYVEGFVVLESDAELDVVAAYSAAHQNGDVETLEIAHVQPRRISPSLKPDLIPVAGCQRKGSQLLVTIRNQGTADAPPSTTRLDFGPAGAVDTSTPPVPANGSVEILVNAPQSCATSCRFRITVDVSDQVDESDETNNVVDSTCIG
jgi:hypothetical protein